MHDEGAREADALAHAARKLARISGLVTVEADEVDGGKRAGADLLLLDAERLEAELHVLQHGEPGKQREALEHHRDAAGGTLDRLSHIDERAALRFRQARDQAQQGRLAGTRAAEQSHDLALFQREIDVVEDQQFAAARTRK